VEQVAAKVASRNEHKLAELRSALPQWELELLDTDEFPSEDGETYYDNARAKARFGRMTGELDVWILGEDSGLEVGVLGGEPGLQSARWSANPIGDLLERLEGIDDRRARYVCELVCLSPELDEFRGTGVLEGRIADRPRGSQGFGYDPVFIPAGEERTVAELGNEWKAYNSHRARAARALLEALRRP
jgi:XTP/dITP diphosphohydrolase